jgi:tetratricopeptide (TPR) repeat protein
MENSPLQDSEAPEFLRKNAGRILMLLLMMFLLVPVVILVWSERSPVPALNEMSQIQAQEKPSSDPVSREQAFNVSPSVAEAISLSNVLANNASYAACERVARAGLKLDSLNIILLNNLGFAQIELRQLGEAQKTLEKAIALKPDFTLAINNLKWCRDEKSKVLKAIQEKEKTGKSADAAYQLSMGLAWFEIGEYEKSNECYRTAIRLSPSDPRPHNNLGLNLMFTGKIRDAVQCFQNASELNPSEQLYKNNLNWALKEADKP